MIVSVSRRTDIPAYYSEWFFQRSQEGYVYTRNPFQYHQVSRVSLLAHDVDCFVFWTKNAKPMLAYLPLLANHHYYFQFTINGYGPDMEPNIPPKKEIIATFQQLSEQIGKHRVIWRYDPILLNDEFTVNYHIQQFADLACQLSPYTQKCVISFIDFYSKIEKKMKLHNVRECTVAEKWELAKHCSHIAKQYGIRLETCSEEIDLSSLDISHASCIDHELISSIIDRPIKWIKDRNQRQMCGCVSSIDIGKYHTCQSGCQYCYATNHLQASALAKNKYDVNSPILCDMLSPLDQIKVRKT